jgi:hypothetical protein
MDGALNHTGDRSGATGQPERVRISNELGAPEADAEAHTRQG